MGSSFPVRPLEPNECTTSVASDISPDGKHLAVAYLSNGTRPCIFYETQAFHNKSKLPPVIKQTPQLSIWGYQLQYDPLGRYFVTGSPYRPQIYHIATNTWVDVADKSNVCRFDISSDGSKIIGAAMEGLTIYDPMDGKKLSVVGKNVGKFGTVKYIDDNTVFAGHDTTGNTEIWNLATNERIQQLDNTLSIAFYSSVDVFKIGIFNYLAFSNKNHEVSLWMYMNNDGYIKLATLWQSFYDIINVKLGPDKKNFNCW